MYKNIIFDFNGTLIDDCRLCLKVLNIICEKHGIKEVSMRRYKEIFTFPVIEYYRKLAFDTTEEAFKEIATMFHYYYDMYSDDEVKLFKDVIKVLDYFKENGYNLYCLSASRQERLDEQLKFYNIYDYFDGVIGISNKYAASKIDAAKSFFKDKDINSSNTLFIGDSIHDKEVADELKADCYLVSTGHTAKHRLLKGTSKVCDSLTEVLNKIK